jgi:pimeloyl-[acyl-carrier protein] methyl ester esterase
MSLYVESRGSGPVLALLHGWGLNLRVWEHLAVELESSFRLLLVDLPGHGHSDWDARGSSLSGLAQSVCEALNEHLASDEAPLSFLGWSLGGQVALELAASSLADRAQSLVLVATTPRFTAAEDWPGVTPSVLQDFARRLAGDYRRTVHDFLELQVRGSADGDAVLRGLESAILHHGEASPQALESGLHILAETDLRPRLERIKQRSLVIAGRNDRVTLPSAARALAAALPHAEYVEIQRAAHAPMLSHTGELARHLREFLAGAPA